MQNESKTGTLTAQPRAAARGAADHLIQTLGRLGRFAGGGFNLPGLSSFPGGGDRTAPGSSPGIESMLADTPPPAAGQVTVQFVDYGPDRTESGLVTDVRAWLESPRPDWSKIRWVDVHGLHPQIVDLFRARYRLHTLAAEDVLRVPQRPKLESYEGHLFIVMRMLMLREARLHSEQVSVFLIGDTVLTFQETAGDVWDPIRRRVQKAGSRLRTHDASYLLYALLDAVVDHCFPILENYGEMLEALEKRVLDNPGVKVQQGIHSVKRELAYLRRVIWPMREVVNQLQREEAEHIAAPVRAYVRDVYDHAVQVIDILETFREHAGGLNDLYMSAVSNRMNEVMKVLTIMASFFIPITFVAGVYGMNFDHIPELHWRYSYLVFWGICSGISVYLAVFFYRRGWIGRGS